MGPETTGTRLVLLDISFGLLVAMLMALCLGAPWWLALPITATAGFFVTLGLGSGWKFKYPKGEG